VRREPAGLFRKHVADGWSGKGRGLSLNQDKTRIGRVDAGFDFLAFAIRRYYVRGGTKVLTKPSRNALVKIRRRNTQELRTLRGADPAEVIRTLNPIIKGRANYYRPGASKKSYQGLDDHLWQQLYKWARRRHPANPRNWPNPGNATCASNKGLCPLCKEPLLYVDHPPDSLKAIVEQHNNRTTRRLVHVRCANRQPGDQAHDPNQ